MASQRKLLKLVQQYLDPDEEILAHVYGAYETQVLGSKTVRNGLFAATDRRVVFYAKRMAGYDFESFPYENISSFEQGKGMMGHRVKFFASGNEAAVKWINKGDVDALVREVRSRMKGGTPTAVSTLSPSQPDAVEELRRYAALRDEGIISEEEFQAKKSQLLS